jgi:NCS1 family nucleobase:cation symporter-1
MCAQSLIFHSASSMIAGGLNWKLAIGALVLGNTIMGAVITINGRIGARVSTTPRSSHHVSDGLAYILQLHTPFPVLARVPFGYYASYFVVASRCALAIIWLG